MEGEGSFHGVFVKKDEHYIAWVEEIPGVNTQGATFEETKANLLDALKLILEANRELAEHDLQERELNGEIAPDKIIIEPICIPAS